MVHRFSEVEARVIYTILGERQRVQEALDSYVKSVVGESPGRLEQRPDGLFFVAPDPVPEAEGMES